MDSRPNPNQLFQGSIIDHEAWVEDQLLSYLAAGIAMEEREKGADAEGRVTCVKSASEVAAHYQPHCRASNQATKHSV
jgi:hypothetical protein